MNTDDELNEAPFPHMTWTDCDWWEGRAALPAWAGFQSRGGDYGALDSKEPSEGGVGITLTPHDPSVSRLPSEAQRTAFRYQMERGDAVVQSVLSSLRSYLDRLRPGWIKFFGAAQANRVMPAVVTSESCRPLLGLHQIHVHPWQRDGMAYVGLEFGCTWDEEHGFGVLLHGNRVVSIGSAEASFASRPQEADKQ